MQRRHEDSFGGISACINRSKKQYYCVFCLLQAQFFHLPYYYLWTYWAVTHLKNQPPLRFLNDWLELYYLENHGAAWGILTGKTIFLIVVTAIVLLVLFVIYFRLPIIKQHRLMRAALMLIASGAVGNLIDFPVFNVADIYVTIGAFLFAVIVLFTKEEAENGE